MTFEEFATAGKERGFSREDVMLKASEYEQKYGSFDTHSSPSLAIASMNRDIMPSNPEQRETTELSLTKEDKERETARRFYDTKFGLRHDDVLLQARMDMEYGGGASPEMVNQYNKQALAYAPEMVWSVDGPIPALDIDALRLRFPDDMTPDPTGGLRSSILSAKDRMFGVLAGVPEASISFVLSSLGKGMEALSGAEGDDMAEVDDETMAEYAVSKSPTLRGLRATSRDYFEWADESASKVYGPTYKGFIESIKDKDPVGFGDAVAKNALVQVPQLATLVVAARVAPQTVPTLLVAPTAVERYTELVEEGSTPEDAIMRGALSGTAEYLGERFGTLKILDRVGVERGIKQATKDFIRGAVSEEATLAIQALERGETSAEEVLSTFITGGLIDTTVGVATSQAQAQSVAEVVEPEVVPYTFGDANTIRNTKSDIEIEQEVATLPEQAQDAARDAFLNPDAEKVNALNQALFEEPAPQVPAVEAVQEIKTIDDVEIIDEADVIGFSTEKINEARQERGEEELTEEEVKSHQSSMDEAMSEGMVATADNLAERVLRSAEDKKTKTYQMDDKEVASLGARTVELRNERIDILKRQKGAMESGDQDAIDQTYIELEQNAAKSDQIENALKTSGTASGRANSMMASMVNRFTYDVVSLESAARTAKGEDLTPQETADIQDVADRIATLEGKIADVKEQLATGEFKETKRRIRQDEPREVTKLRTELALLQREARNKIYDLRKKSARDWLKEIATLPRSLMATADMSYGLRQGLLPSFAHPKIAASAWGKAFKSFFSQKTAAQIDLEMRDHPLHTEIAALGTHFSSLDSAIEDRTEFFASNLAEKIPAFGKVVMASERNMVTGINLLRQGLMVDFLTKHPDASTEAKKAYARYVNIATGRGEAKLLDRAAEELSIAFFAPRFAVSRIQAPVEAARLLKHPELRAEIVKQWASYLGTGMTVLALAKMAGADVEDDPESSDWGKIVIDNKHIDIWGGIQQPMRILAKAVKGGVEQITEGETDVNTISDIGNFLKYKLSPPVAIFNELLSGEDVIGRETEEIEIGNIDLPESATVFVKNVTPLIIQSAVEAYQEGEDPAVVAALAIGEGLGLSIGVYDKKTK